MRKLIILALFSCMGMVALNSCHQNSNKTTETVDSALMPIIVFKEISFDFGTINQGDTVTHDFVFSNEGKTPLTILEAVPSCGCTTPNFTKEAIATGKTGSIHVVFNSTNFSGKVLKTVQVISNATENPVMIHLEGNITPKNK